MCVHHWINSTSPMAVESVPLVVSGGDDYKIKVLVLD